MVTAVYIWFDYTKPAASITSRIGYIAKVDVERVKKAIDKIKAKDMLKVQSFKYFSHDVELSISMQELSTGKVLYRRELK